MHIASSFVDQQQLAVQSTENNMAFDAFYNALISSTLAAQGIDKEDPPTSKGRSSKTRASLRRHRLSATSMPLGGDFLLPGIPSYPPLPFIIRANVNMKDLARSREKNITWLDFTKRDLLEVSDISNTSFWIARKMNGSDIGPIPTYAAVTCELDLQLEVINK